MIAKTRTSTVSAKPPPGPARTDAPQDPDQFLEQMDQELTGWNDLADRLERALHNNELLLYAQPIESLRERGTYPIAETLVRLREEEAAMLPPGAFLPVFEHCGMMPELDRWVIQHVIQTLAKGTRVPRFSINISAQTLGDAGFSHALAKDLESAGVSPDALVFEIDETDLLARPDAAARFSAAVKSIGCRLLFDGFGRRSVSFEPLKTLRVDYVKVDGVIIRKLASSDVARSKLNAISRVGEVIGVGVIGECVEDENVIGLLKTAGVGFAQGFGIAAPQAIEGFATSSS
jgi:EAL domain-containing protein (putative c-di-GMP-specific phosphodiesterase class I)